MKKLVFILFLFSGFIAKSQDEGNGNGAKNGVIPGVDFLKQVSSDSTVTLIKTIPGFRGISIPGANKVVWFSTPQANGFIIPDPGSSLPDDSVFHYRDGGNNPFRRVLSNGTVPFEIFVQAFASGNDITYALQKAMQLVPYGYRLTFTDSAAYTTSAMSSRSIPIQLDFLNNKISITQVTPYTSMLYFNSDSCTVTGGNFYQTGQGDENDFPRGYGSAIIFQDVQKGCFVRKASIYNCGDYLNAGQSSPRSATGQPYAGSGKLTSSAGVYITRSGGVQVQDCYIKYSITGVNSDGYQNKNVGTPGYKQVSKNDIDHNEIVDCWQGIVFDGLDSAGLLDAFPGWIHRNYIRKTPAFTATNTPGTIGVKIFTNNSNNGTIVEDNWFSGRFSAAAVAQTGSYQTSFTNNRFDSCYDCIVVQNAGKVPRNIDISLNKFNASAHSDITMIGAYESQIYQNKSINGRGNGIVLTGYCVGIDMAHNNFTKMAGHAYQFESGYSFTVDGGYLIDVAGLSGIIATDTAVISINPAGTTGVLYDVNIFRVHFDHQFTDGVNPTLVSKTAIRAHGQWANSNSAVGSGRWDGNFYGRTRVLDDLGERSYGARKRNDNFGGIYDTARANIGEVLYDENNFLRQSVNNTGTATYKANGTAPQNVFPDSTTIQKILFATGGVRTNATLENGNLGSSGSTGVTTTTDSRFTLFGQSSTIVANTFNGSTGATMTGTASAARSDFGSPTYTLNGSNNNVGNAAFKAPTLVAGTGTAAMGYTLALQGLSTLGTRNSGLWLYNSNIVGDNSFAYTPAPGNTIVINSDSSLGQTAGPGTFNIATGTSLTMSTSVHNQIFSGTSATTWTLPSIASAPRMYYYIKNRGSASITLTASSGDNLYNTSAVATFTVSAGQAYYLFNDGTYWNVE
jgi:hypothetical protein